MSILWELLFQQPARAVVIEPAPIYLLPDATRVPLRTAAVKTVLRVLDDAGDWLKVEFQDPQYGPRQGYVEARHVRVNRPELEPMDLSVPPARAPRSADVPPSETPSEQHPNPSTGSDVLNPNKHRREGFWFNVGPGYGTLGCENCIGRLDGLSGGLSLGATLSPRVLLGVGTSGYVRSEEGVSVTVGTLDGRLRFYPSLKSGFFLTGGLGLGTLSVGDESNLGVGAVLGLGWDIRVGRNISLTPFWNGFAMSSSVADANVGQLGLGITVH